MDETTHLHTACSRRRVYSRPRCTLPGPPNTLRASPQIGMLQVAQPRPARPTVWGGLGNNARGTTTNRRYHQHQWSRIWTPCGPWHKNLTVMRRRLYVKTDKLGDRHPRHKKIPSIIFWLGQCVSGWEKITGAIGRWTGNAVPTPPTWTDLNTTNSQCFIALWKSAVW